MKKIKIYLLIMASAMMFTSCELDLYPETNLSDAAFWNSHENFEQACNRLYMFPVATAAGRGGTRVFGIRYEDNKSDFSIGPDANTISSGSRIAPTTSADWNTPYQMIFTANKIIENAEDATFNTDRWKAEALFFRAWAYFELTMMYGDVPLILRVLDVGDPEFDEGRTDRLVVLNKIYEDLDFAIANLPTWQQLGEAGYGRVSRSAALGMKTRVGLYFGTHMKYHDWGSPDTHLNLAISAAEAAMNEGHELYTQTDDPFYNLFQNTGQGFGNKENIFSAIYGADLSNNIRAHNIGRDLENGAANVTRPMVDLYLSIDGLPYDQSPLSEYPEIDHLSIFKNKDPRMSASLFKEGDEYGNPAQYPMLTTSYVLTFFAGRKYSIVADWSAGQSFVDVHIIRYAEILLNLAEALYERDGSISDADLNRTINQLRDRVEMPHLTNGFVATHGLDMKFEIRRERSVELAQEGFRYNDIIRWKIAEEVLPKRVIGATFFADLYREGLTVTPDGFIQTQSAGTRSFDINRDYLYPIPIREIALSGGAITQNPGW